MNKYIEGIKDLRIKKGASQESVANVLGVSRPTYTAIETGRQKLSLDEAQKLANYFGLDIDTLASGIIPDVEKYKDMIISFLRLNLSADGRVPKTKLAKLLYLADFAWFYHKLESMSGMQYRRIAHGPVPDLFFRALDELESDGKIIIDRKKDTNRDVFLVSESDSNHNQKINSISKEELTLIKKIGNKWKKKNTREIVNFSHNQLPYFLCRDNEIIPYELITQEDPTNVF